NPYGELAGRGFLNGFDTADDQIAGLCHGVFAWPMHLTPANPAFALDLRLPVGNFQTVSDLHDMSAANANALDSAVTAGWAFTLFHSGTRYELPSSLNLLANQDALSRAQLLILADSGEIHPGPTIYDSFWIRDSSVEGIACALAGQEDLAEAQFGTHYR